MAASVYLRSNALVLQEEDSYNLASQLDHFVTEVSV
jgi:hypothetical protein